ncbi:hypothetical protein LNP25_05970 [Klebsiella variicola subsp. variicola]|nr:hypothetical protein [Klebsiella variicola subsp. variicola]
MCPAARGWRSSPSSRPRFFGQNGALAVFSLYVLGIVMAILTGLMLKHTIMRGEASPFVMELPVYHVPPSRA